MIKFRAYETDRKAMHYTDKDLVVCFSDNGVDVIDHTTFSSSCMDIDNFVLMQSTGIKDKNGFEIFEGDVVKHDPVPNPFFENTNFEIVQTRTGEWRIDSIRGGSVLAFHNHQVEIIGNKYQHPHLLEGDNE